MVWGSTLGTSLFLYRHNLHEEMSASKGTHHRESGFQEVTHSSSATLGLCVTILDTSEPEKRLDATMRQRDTQDKRASCCATVPLLWGRGKWWVLEALHKHALFA